MRVLFLSLVSFLFVSTAWAACVLPDGVEGEIVYNQYHQVPQYCDGTRWIGIGWKNAALRGGGNAGAVQFNGDDGVLNGDDSFVWNDDQKYLSVSGGVYPFISGGLGNVDISTYPRGLSITSGADSEATGFPSHTTALTVNHSEYRNFQLAHQRARNLDPNASYPARLWHRSCHSGLCSPWLQVISESHNGFVGIKRLNPVATLDVNGFAKLALNNAEPATCNTSMRGAIALTSGGGMCVCTTANAWRLVNTTTACTW